MNVSTETNPDTTRPTNTAYEVPVRSFFFFFFYSILTCRIYLWQGCSQLKRARHESEEVLVQTGTVSLLKLPRHRYILHASNEKKKKSLLKLIQSLNPGQLNQ